MKDEILDEVRAIREAHAAAFDLDLDAIYADIKQREADHQARGARFVDPPAVPGLTRSPYRSIRFGHRPNEAPSAEPKRTE